MGVFAFSHEIRLLGTVTTYKQVPNLKGLVTACLEHSTSSPSTRITKMYPNRTAAHRGVGILVLWAASRQTMAASDPGDAHLLNPSRYQAYNQLLCLIYHVQG